MHRPITKAFFQRSADELGKLFVQSLQRKGDFPLAPREFTLLALSQSKYYYPQLIHSKMMISKDMNFRKAANILVKAVLLGGAKSRYCPVDKLMCMSLQTRVQVSQALLRYGFGSSFFVTQTIEALFFSAKLVFEQRMRSNLYSQHKKQLTQILNKAFNLVFSQHESVTRLMQEVLILRELTLKVASLQDQCLLLVRLITHENSIRMFEIDEQFQLCVELLKNKILFFWQQLIVKAKGSSIAKFMAFLKMDSPKLVAQLLASRSDPCDRARSARILNIQLRLDSLTFKSLVNLSLFYCQNNNNLKLSQTLTKFQQLKEETACQLEDVMMLAQALTDRNTKEECRLLINYCIINIEREFQSSDFIRKDGFAQFIVRLGAIDQLQNQKLSRWVKHYQMFSQKQY